MTAANSYFAYVFSNCGPLTTTFTQLATCTSARAYRLAFTGVTKEDCDDYRDSRRLYETLYGAYFSPGLYCPSLWETVRMAARDTSSPLTSSGILTGYSHDDHLNCPDWIYDCADSGSLMKHALQPKCCPMYLPFAPSFYRRLFDTTIDGPMGSSGVVANSSGVCIPVDPNYAVSKGCQGHEAYSYQYAKTTYTYTNGSTTGVSVFNSATSTFRLYDPGARDI
ncbi:hypothetical protein BJX68DRAFT_260994 [Aspergillus pseudodeflectus]|uniref:Uncharacterized protein n=1 Tax=Aspergillus pseudodeflectus TaxID=176178 RepID=A0ABR4L974_9EURO